MTIRKFTTANDQDQQETKVDVVTYNAQIAQIQADIAAKAPFLDPVILNSIVLPSNTSIGTPTIGVPAAPTAATGTNTTQIATTEFVQQEASTSTAALTRTAMILQFAAAHG